MRLHIVKLNSFAPWHLQCGPVRRVSHGRGRSVCPPVEAGRAWIERYQMSRRPGGYTYTADVNVTTTREEIWPGREHRPPKAFAELPLWPVTCRMNGRSPASTNSMKTGGSRLCPSGLSSRVTYSRARSGRIRASRWRSTRLSSPFFWLKRHHSEKSDGDWLQNCARDDK